MAEKMLLADGETVLLDTLADALTSEGYETFRANDGFEAMRVTVESTSDLIITGVQILVLVGCLSPRYVRRRRLESIQKLDASADARHDTFKLLGPEGIESFKKKMVEVYKEQREELVKTLRD